MAPRWRRRGAVSIVLFLFLSSKVSNSRTLALWSPSRSHGLTVAVRIFDVEIRRELNVAECELLSEETAEAADENGELGGNALYQDLRGATWAHVRAVLEVEGALIRRVAEAADPAAAEAEYEEQRDTDPDNLEGLCGLDLGVAAAAAALSALGATPFISCNAGSFGGHHPAKCPYVAFYLSSASPARLLALAEAAGVGFGMRDGPITLYARSIIDLREFAQRAADDASQTGQA